MLSVSDELTKNADEIDEVLSALVIKGYDKHPEVGPLIEETRDLYWEANLCMTKLTGKYGDWSMFIFLNPEVHTKFSKFRGNEFAKNYEIEDITYSKIDKPSL